MITKVIKSDGSEVVFDPERLNKAAIFGDDGNGNWSHIALDAYRRLYDGCTTKEVNQAIIDACISRKDEAHARMAGRVLVGQIYKEAFGGFTKIPSLPNFYHRMVDSGYWEDMKYTGLELTALEAVIDHSKDLSYGYAVLKQFRDKYGIKDAVNDILFESPQMMFMGMAMAVMKNMPKARRIKDVTKLYTYLSDLKINAPTPYLNGLRTGKTGYASCCVIKADDTAKSIGVAREVAYTMTVNQAGIGYYLASRSIGDGVRGNTIKHMGKLPYYRGIDAGVKENRQQSRGGSATVSFLALDPQIDELIRLRNPMTVTSKRINTMDYSVGINKSFVNRVAKNLDWMLVSYKDAPQLHDGMFTMTMEEFDSEVDKIAKDASIPKTWIKARDLAIEIITQRTETGRLYVYWTDEMNRHTPFKEIIYSSNLCVAPETEILTKDGYQTISDLKDRSVEVWNGEEWSEVVIRKTGSDQKLITVVTDSGQELVCTPYHKFYIQEGFVGKGRVIEKRAIDLQPGDKLVKFTLSQVVHGSKVLDLAYENGFYSGDGCEVSENRKLVYLYGGKKHLLSRFRGEFKISTQELQDRHTLVYKDNLKTKFFVPSSEYTLDSRLEWLAGYLDADGCVYRNGDNQQLTCASVNKNFLVKIQRLLQEVGVHSKIVLASKSGPQLLPLNNGSGDYGVFNTKDAFRLLISSTETQKLLEMGLKLYRLVLVKHKPNRNAGHFVRIVGIKDDGRRDDTYCFSEPKRHMGVFNGLLTGQCQEISLPTKGYSDMRNLFKYDAEDGEVALCFLASLVAGRVKPEEYEDVAYYTVLMIDNVMDIMTYPYENMESTVKKRRSIGVGITNVAHYIATHRVPYGSPESKQLVHDLAELHSYSLHKASLRLAKERGVCEWIGKTKYPSGWLPIDTYNKAIDSVVKDPTLKQDWESLRKEIIDFGGIRNSVLEAYMPNESSSLATNTTNGIYPVRDHVIFKKSPQGQVLFIVPDYEELKDYYTSAWDTPTNDMIDIYALFQKFTGQTISADLYLDYTKQKDGKISMKEQLGYLIKATKVGMKTWYYLNSKVGAGDSLTAELHAKRQAEEETKKNYPLIADSSVEDPYCESCAL